MFFSVSTLLWLLLPLAAGSGWGAGRLEQRRQSARKDLPSAYFKGLNYLLNEQADKAIEIFIKVLEVNSETVETHLALGSLFRRRGEVERAIRVHQNIIARPALEKAQRARALLELGQDYLKAGLFDRAENLFLELAEIRAHTDQALRLLMNIYQQEREWEKAITVCRRLGRVINTNLNDVIAQYHCELAEAAYGRQEYDAAREQARRALQSDRGCVRASLVLGRIEASLGAHREAIKAWHRIELQDPHYLGEIAPQLAASYRALDDEAGLFQFLQEALNRHADVATMLAMADVIEQRQGLDAAEAFVVSWLRRKPSVRGLHRLVGLHAAQGSGLSPNDLAILKGIMEQIVEHRRHYVCGHCGFSGRTIYWQCPGCHRWNTVKPAGDDRVT
ncbi:MAG: lipopolysaccharide assembly protein LapB [Gammaproteobacteria bacterium]|nr:lipopolysaccharide assembly protein LapB [Gammaproteobacteria bacterium]